MFSRAMLAKLIGMTGSAHDGEALTAVRMANAYLQKHKLTWAEVLEAEPLSPDEALKLEIEEAFKIVGSPLGGFGEFIASIREQWEQQGWLSKKQREALFRARDRKRAR